MATELELYQHWRSLEKENKMRLLFRQLLFQVFLVFFVTILLDFKVLGGNSLSGISPLIQLSEKPIKSLIESDVRPLFTPLEQESFLSELEGSPPTWRHLHDHEGEEPGDRLFTFNRQRDEARENHALLKQRIAFLWSGILRQYLPDHQGFTVAIGPELTSTEWGIVRFKPMGLPNEMVAIPPLALHSHLQTRLNAGDQVEITILFTGRLIPNESIMYGFSHDDPDQGMILPVVQVDRVRYFQP